MNSSETKVKDLEALLAGSKAEEQFKDAVRALGERRPQDRIAYNIGSPPVKVQRMAMKLLEERPDLALASLKVEASSGCSDFKGKAVAEPGGLKINFTWDCAWRAKQEGWKDSFGDTDQIRAARTFGYQCFEKFEVRD